MIIVLLQPPLPVGLALLYYVTSDFIVAATLYSVLAKQPSRKNEGFDTLNTA